MEAKEFELRTQGQVSTQPTKHQKAGQVTPGPALFYQGLCTVFAFLMWTIGIYLEPAIYQFHCGVCFSAEPQLQKTCPITTMSSGKSFKTLSSSSWQIYKTGLFTQISLLLWRPQLHFIVYFSSPG